jgi:hypothetical protein
LREACEAEANGVSSDSSHEVRNLEDSVFAAALAAQKTMKLRRQMERLATGQHSLPSQNADAPAIKEGTDTYEVHQAIDVVAEDAEATDTSVREFTDDAGHTWRAWPVIPRQSQTNAKRRGLLGDFQAGWICFEGVNIAARRRLPYRPASWATLTERDLRGLLGESIDAAPRRGDETQSR